MFDEYSEVSRESWLTRIGCSFLEVLIGLLFVPLSIILLYWNEGRAVNTTRSLAEGVASVISIDAMNVSQANNNKLVHLSGNVTTPDTLTDPVFGVSANGIRLTRRVEIYQWEENKYTEKTKNLGGETVTVTRYSYERRWSTRRVNSSNFQHPEGHINPGSQTSETALEYTAMASHVAIGTFEVAPELFTKMRGDEPLTPRMSRIFTSNTGVKGIVIGDEVYFGADPAIPAIGDEKVTFRILRPGPCSVLAQQQGYRLAPYPTHAGKTIERIEPGTLSAEQMFHDAEAENKQLTWLLRVVGCVAMCLGFGFMAAPLGALADLIPFFGSIVELGTTLAAIVLGLIGSAVTIAIAWIVPSIFGWGLIALAILMYFFGGSSRGRART